MNDMLNNPALASIAEIRLANLISLIAKFESKAEFCRRVGIGQPQLAQFFMQPGTSGHRKPGRELCRKVELALGLVENSLDRPDLQQQKEPANAVLDLTGLSALHMATLEALFRAIKAGALSDRECAQLLSQWVGDVNPS